MKGKVINYLVIVAVSIILLLGIVTTAFGQDNPKSFDDYTIKFIAKNDNYAKCEGEKPVPIFYKKKLNNNNFTWPTIGCIERGLDVKIIGIKDKYSKYIQIKGNYKPEFLGIENRFLEEKCSKSNSFTEKTSCKTVIRR
ncbi:MAG: hypothetical protein F6K65_11235 [Moorea sp. SIO3C2]|nr:hypothetical protein [Moorena sp. SIO3C2]